MNTLSGQVAGERHLRVGMIVATLCLALLVFLKLSHELLFSILCVLLTISALSAIFIALTSSGARSYNNDTHTWQMTYVPKNVGVLNFVIGFALILFLGLFVVGGGKWISGHLHFPH